MGEARGIEARPGISYLNKYLLGIYPTRCHHELAWPVVHPVHRFDGVDDEIEDHLLKLDPISWNERQLR